MFRFARFFLFHPFSVFEKSLPNICATAEKPAIVVLYDPVTLTRTTTVKFLVMGADKPPIGRNDIETRKSLLPLLIVANALLIAVTLFSKLSYSGENEMTKLSPRDEAKLQKRLKEIDEAEQYALIAKINGWYPCLHSGRTTCYLKDGEVWKYGVTSKGEFGRYNAEFLLKNKVFYIVQFKGNYSECLKQEQIRLFNYPYLPENLARPPSERLSRPPYNAIMR